VVDAFPISPFPPEKQEPKYYIMEAVHEDIVIVGAGIAGLTTSLGLHRYPSSLDLLSCVCINYMSIYEGLELLFKIVKNTNIYVVGWAFEA